MASNVPVFHSGKILDERNVVNSDLSRAFLYPYPCNGVFAVTWIKHTKTNKSDLVTLQIFASITNERFFHRLYYSLGLKTGSHSKSNTPNNFLDVLGRGVRTFKFVLPTNLRLNAD